MSNHSRLVLLFAFAFATQAQSQILPGTQPLTPNPDFSATMVAGIDKMALRLIEQSKAGRRPTREKLKAAIGIVDERAAASHRARARWRHGLPCPAARNGAMLRLPRALAGLRWCAWRGHVCAAEGETACPA